jgi:hypothetical protein
MCEVKHEVVYEAADGICENGMCVVTDEHKEDKGMRKVFGKIGQLAMNREEGLDGILVTIGLCIIALLLCVVMRDSLTEFIQTIVSEMTNSAKNILATAGTLVIPGVTS